MLADDDLGSDRCAFESERLAQPGTIGDAPNIFERRFRLCLVSPFLATRLKSDPGMTMNLDPTQGPSFGWECGLVSTEPTSRGGRISFYRSTAGSYSFMLLLARPPELPTSTSAEVQPGILEGEN
jgi:hypothetical protein